MLEVLVDYFFFPPLLSLNPPLNNVSDITLNNTDITCGAVDDTTFKSNVTAISLFGEQLRMSLDVQDHLTHCLCIYPLHVSLPLLMT